MAEDPSEVMEAIEGFVADIDGERFIVNRGTTRVNRSHVLVQRYPQNFQSVSEGLSFGTEAATANPGEVRERTDRPAGDEAQQAPAQPASDAVREPAGRGGRQGRAPSSPSSTTQEEKPNG